MIQIDCQECGKRHPVGICPGPAAGVKFTPAEIREAFVGLRDLPPAKKAAPRLPKSHVAQVIKETLDRMPKVDGPVVPAVKAALDEALSKPAYDRNAAHKAYMREYMKKYRAKKRAKKDETP